MLLVLQVWLILDSLGLKERAGREGRVGKELPR